jgi:hypothetical protein
VGSNPEQQSDDDTTYRRLHATRKWQRRDSGSAEVKRDGDEMGDRYHLIALI